MGHRHHHQHRHGHFGRGDGGVTDVYHHIVCRHRVEIEVWPARAELNFRDEWTANPINTQFRFDATLYNSEQGCLWEVRDPSGNSGQGTIDETGLYRAPLKGTLASGTTEIIVATAREDRLRKAYAWVTLVGVGPEPVTPPSVDIWPKRLDLYYRQGADNAYIDDCNKMREFGATVRDSSAQVEWLVDGTLQATGSPWFLYQTPATGSTRIVTIRARLQGQPSVYDDAKILQRNYDWPGI